VVQRKRTIAAHYLIYRYGNRDPGGRYGLCCKLWVIRNPINAILEHQKQK
jgi:hypothetical protein